MPPTRRPGRIQRRSSPPECKIRVEVVLKRLEENLQDVPPGRRLEFGKLCSNTSKEI